MAFKKATRRKGKLRMGLVGGPGTGKTWTALTFATALAGPTGSIAVIDTEHGSASKYASEEPGDGLFNFDAEEPSEFDPRDLLRLISEAAKENYSVLIIDSFSHYWSGRKGMLEQAQGGGNHSNFNKWKDLTPIERRIVDALLTYPGDVIVCMRAKTDYLVDNSSGKPKPQKIGIKPDQRVDIEFEFDIVAYMKSDGVDVEMTVEKTRCSDWRGAIITNPNAESLEPVKQWMSRGADDDTEIWNTRIHEATDENSLMVIYQDMEKHGVVGRWRSALTMRKEELRSQAAASDGHLTMNSTNDQWLAAINKATTSDDLDEIKAQAQKFERYEAIQNELAKAYVTMSSQETDTVGA